MQSLLNLKGKKILVGVCGSIAAYKVASLVRLLVKASAEVKVIMTGAAQDFITPLTLSVLSKNPVLSEFFDKNGTWNNHVELGLWADAIVIAPATAKTLSHCATGNADDLLNAVYLSARCPVFFAPAMDLDMYKHPSTQQNIHKLISFGNHFIQPGDGELASGLVGEGRLAEPEEIAAELHALFSKKAVAAGKKVLITAGPTVEDIDPVRYITNRSSGKMGYAIANAFAAAGASVTLVSGPTAQQAAQAVDIVHVNSAAQMLDAASHGFEQSDLVIFAAAVADYRPANPASQKIKKAGDTMQLELTKNPDIAATLGARKKDHQLLGGFALETENELEYATSKLDSKNLDFIILNSLNDPGAGFAHDTNKITVIEKDGTVRRFALKPKDEVAQDILNLVLEKWSEA